MALDTGRKCKAKRIDGQPCERTAILGGNVCVWHGGSAPAAQRNAKLRLLAMVEPAIEALEAALEGARHDRDWSSVIKAATVLLDRAGHGMKSTVLIEDNRSDILTLSEKELEARALRLAGELRATQEQQEMTGVRETTRPGSPVH